MSVKTKKISEENSAEDNQKHLNNVALRTYSGQQKSDKGLISDEQISEFIPMVHKIVNQVVTYLKPPLSFEDMVSAGTVGLVKAARDFDPSHSAEFKTYAYIRIKGAVLDELRGWSSIPSNLSKRIRDAQQVSQSIMHEKGSAPDDYDLAEELGITVTELHEMFDSARAQHFISLDGYGDDIPGLGNVLPADRNSSPDEQVERAELIEKLAEGIQKLTENQRQVILLYYQQHLTMKQIAEVLEITESRVSQVHSSALFNLSVKLRQWKDDRI